MIGHNALAAVISGSGLPTLTPHLTNGEDMKTMQRRRQLTKDTYHGCIVTLDTESPSLLAKALLHQGPQKDGPLLMKRQSRLVHPILSLRQWKYKTCQGHTCLYQACGQQ